MSRRFDPKTFARAAAGALALVSSLSIARGAQAHDPRVCIDDSVRATLTTCPGGAKQEQTPHVVNPQPSFHGVTPPSNIKKHDDPTKPGPATDLPRDERTNRLSARKRAMLVVEIQGLEALFAQTPRAANDRPTIARRLAEDYVELEAAAFRDKVTAEIARDEAKKQNDGLRASQQQAEANQADGVMKIARQKAVVNYTLVKNDYPSYPQLDEILYYLAYEYEQAQDFANARKAYYELIQKAPSSRFIPNAYLAFGELFFNEGQGDPSRFPLAEKAYLEVLKFPPPNNKVFGYAHYKLAYVYWNQGDFPHAMSEMKKTIEYGVAFSQLPGAAKTAESARRDIVPLYALSGDPDKAFVFMKTVSGDQAGVSDKTFKMMDDLGMAYLDTGHYPEGIAVYRDLENRNRTGNTCMYQAHVTEATMAMRASNKEAIVLELSNQLKSMRDFKARDTANADAKTACSNKTASLVTETAMAWHLEAVGSQGQRGTGDQKTLTAAAALYKRAVDTWTADELAHFTFPRLVKEDWPTLYKIKYALADILYFQERWAECGPAFEAVVAENPNAPEAQEAAYAEVLCFGHLYDREHGHGEGRRSANVATRDDAHLRPKDMSESQKGMLKAFDRYICTISPPPEDKPAQQQMCEVKYARARTYFEAQHWEEAAAAFRDIAIHPCDLDAGVYAAQLYLESANVLASRVGEKRPGCFGDMRADVPKFQELYCTGDLARTNADQCTSLSVVAVDLQRKEAEAKVARGDAGGPQALADLEAGGGLYFDLFRKYCQEPVLAGRPAQAERCDEIAYDAAKAFQAAKLVAKAIVARQALLDFDARTNGKSALARKAMFEIGQNEQAIAAYDLAADWFERFQKADPRADKADSALSDAVLLRLGLGQEEKAIEDARAFSRAYGDKKPHETAQIAFAVGAHYAEKEDWEKTRSSLAGATALVDRAPADVQVEAHATLGRAYSHLHADAQARTEYALVRALWRNPDDAVAKIAAAYPNDDDLAKDKRIKRTLTAVGEAYFYAAEEAKRSDVDPLLFPTYHGSGTKADVENHVNVKIRDWYTKKMAAIEKVEAEYAKILDLKPMPPPKWVIAAGSRAGLMWGDFVDDFRRSPIPTSWKKTVLEQIYTTGIDNASEPYKVKHAKPALKKCLDLSVKYQYFDEHSRACEVWLAKNYQAEYHVVDELRSAPSLVNSGLTERVPAVVRVARVLQP
jgi:tetratricopeptide (TPR) repeat protein